MEYIEKEEYKDSIYNGKKKDFLDELKERSNKGNKDGDDTKDDNDIKASNDIRDNKASNDIKGGNDIKSSNDIRDNKDSNDNKGSKDSSGENNESVIKSIWYGGKDVNVLNMDKAEVEEALQELNSIYYRTTHVNLPALDKLLDNLDDNGVNK